MKRSLSCLLILLTLGLTANASAQDVASFRLKSESAARKAASAAIDRSLKPIPWMYHSMARPRFEKMTQPCQSVRIEQTKETIVVHCTRASGKKLVHTAPRDGSSTRIKNEKGEPVELRHILSTKDGVTILTQKFHNKSSGGTWTTRYTYPSSGDMRARIKISGPKLKVPLTYKLTYVRP